MGKAEGDSDRLSRPSVFLLLTEGGRAVLERGASIPYIKFRRYKNKGDGHPVLVLPGFLASDTSTAPLRKFVKNLGYTPYGWDLGRNTAKIEFLNTLFDKLDSIYASHDEKISLIGWSLGGVFARQMAKQKPELIRQVITMGSPFRDLHQPNNVAWIYNMMSHRERLKESHPLLSEDIPLPAPVPTTAVYSKEDGIVPWQVCLEDEDEIHQNIQVRGSHVGLGVNPAVLNIVADRLMYKRENWIPFRPKGFFKGFWFYPSL